MQTSMEILWKSSDRIMAGWNPEPATVVTSYKIYVGLAPVLSGLTLLQAGISPYRSDVPQSLKKVACEVLASSIQTVLGLTSSQDFSNTRFYFAITYVNSAGAESAIVDSILVEVPPVGIGSKVRNADNPVYESYGLGFSDDLQKWIKLALTNAGATIVSSSDFHKANIISEYTYDGTNLASIKAYPTDMTVAGAPAKLTTYEYSGSLVTKITVSDSTV